MFMSRICTFVILVILLCGTIDGKRINGSIDSTNDWEFIFESCFISSEGFYYEFEYPVEYAPINLLLYYDSLRDTVYNDTLTCEEKESKLSWRYRQIIELTENGSRSGCTKNNATGMYSCSKFNYFRSSEPRWWYFAFSRCNGNNPSGIKINYDFNLTNAERLPLERDKEQNEEICTRIDLEDEDCISGYYTTISLSCDYDGSGINMTEVRWYLNDADVPYAINPDTCLTITYDSDLYETDKMEHSCNAVTQTFNLLTPTKVGDSWSCTFVFQNGTPPIPETVVISECKEDKDKKLPAVAIVFIVIGSVMLVLAFVGFAVFFRRGCSKMCRSGTKA